MKGAVGREGEAPHGGLEKEVFRDIEGRPKVPQQDVDGK